MANSQTVSAVDAEIIKSTYQKEIREKGVRESERREFAVALVQAFTGQPEVDPDLLDWILRK